MDTAEIKDLRYRNCEHPRWDNVAARCLTCANCTMVCPTGFCRTVEDVTDLKGEHAERWQKGFMLHHGFSLYSRREHSRTKSALSPVDDVSRGVRSA